MRMQPCIVAIWRSFVMILQMSFDLGMRKAAKRIEPRDMKQMIAITAMVTGRGLYFKMKNEIIIAAEQINKIIVKIINRDFGDKIGNARERKCSTRIPRIRPTAGKISGDFAIACLKMLWRESCLSIISSFLCMESISGDDFTPFKSVFL